MKKMRYWILILFSLRLTASIAQTFSQEITNNVTIDSFKYALLSSPNQNWVALTEVDVSNDFREKISTLITDGSGEIQFANVYETLDTNFSIASKEALQLPNGDVLLIGTYSLNNNFIRYPFLMSLDSNGDINWTKQLNITTASGSFFLKQLSDNSILVHFNYNDGALHQVLFKLDELGNCTDFHEYNFISARLQTVLVYDGYFEMLLSDGSFINIENDLQTINWQRTYFHEIGVTINKALNGDYLLATAQVAFPGHMTVSRLSPSGTVIWSKYIETFDTVTSSEFDIVGFHFIAENPNGDIIVCADSEGGGNGSLIVQLDENGNYLSNHKSTAIRNKMTDPTNNQFIYGGFLGLGAFNTSNFVLNRLHLTSHLDCHEAYEYTISDGQQTILTSDAFVLNPISDISTSTISVVAVSKVHSQEDYCNNILSISTSAAESLDISIYPNPASAHVKIQSKSPVVRVAVFDLSGKLLFEHLDETKIDIGQLESGIYLIEVETEEFELFQRVVKN